ncbi:MAG: hypothetical protein M3Y70_06485 [Pseudomonadota bacterium]|nr:hypothetical protein [Pseudomonadota bacterium]
MKTLAKVVLASTIALALPAFAQETIGTLTVNSGTVMTSTGGEFASAGSGEAIQTGEQVMLGENSSASITFSNGAVVNYTAPGVYTISGLPAAGAGAGAVGTAGGASTAATVGIIAGAAALGALGVENAGEGEEVPPDQPISR